MKTLIAVALVATSAPMFTTTALARDGASASTDRRICTQVSVGRAGSRMGPRRICRTPAQWREALGPDWRQHLGGGRGVEADYDSVQVRAAPEDEAVGVASARERAGPCPL
ncbi:MAG TPA: hypothetical protein VMG08_21530 [Allosphingosinicella sp.]|nr:hypothetical protein [Allosphingosinicella sp.]